MRNHPATLGLLLFASTLGLALPLPAAVAVSFANPDGFTDASDRSRSREDTMREIEAHLKQLGERYLGPRQTLRIEVLDIDLAGRTRITARADPDLRVLEGGADWPRIDVRYTLEANGRASEPVKETISDMSYLQRIDPRYASTTALAYEKRMLEDWFRERFVEHKPPR